MKLTVILTAALLLARAAPGQVAGAPASAAEQPPQDPAGIAGVVYNAATGEPLRKATIIMRAADARRARGSAYSAVSDAAGRFTITNLNPGDYRLSAERTGFARQEFGARRPDLPGSTLHLAPGEIRKGIELRLTPQGVITGRVLDEDGDPMQNVMVAVSRMRYVDGRRQLMPAAQSVSTNDLGEYRIFGLAPGRYYLSASSRRGWVDMVNGSGDEAYPPTFYPGTTSPDGAAALDVAPGATLQGMDLTMRRISAVQITGRVLGPDTQPARAIVMLMPRGQGSAAYMGQRVSRAFDNQGRFQFTGVTPGSYFLSAQRNDGDERLWARVNIDVGSSNLENIVLTLAEGSALTGVVTVEGGSEPVPSGLRVTLQPESRFRRPSSPVNPDGKFALANVMADAYRINVDGVPDSYYTKSIRFGSADVAESGLDFTNGVTPGELAITLANTAAYVDGSVQDASGQPAAGVRVVLLPEKRSSILRPKIATTDQNGQFSIGGLPPGEYKAYAFDGIETGAWEDPEFMKPFESSGETISVKDGERKTVQLKLIVVES